MTVRARSLYHGAPTVPHNITTALWTVPAGRTAILKELTALSFGSATVTVAIALRRAGLWVFTDWREGVTVRTGITWRGAAHVIQSGDAFGLYQVHPTSAGHPFNVTLSGALLLGDPT